MKKTPLFISILLLLSLSSCVNYTRESGVENLWRQPQSFINGSTTSKDILSALGPPSQVLQLNGKVIYYYLQEQVTGEGMVLILYNKTSETTTFDRAIFIFNKNNVLEDYSYSKHKAQPDKK